MISLVLLTYVIAVFLKGNGILAVYLAGLMLGNAEFPNKKMIMKFHEGLACANCNVCNTGLACFSFAYRSTNRGRISSNVSSYGSCSPC